MTIELLGLFGTLLLAIGGLPQLIKTVKDKHADGLSGGMLWCWLLGFMLLLMYTIKLHPHDWILLFNYGFNLIVVLVFLKYKYMAKRI